VLGRRGDTVMHVYNQAFARVPVSLCPRVSMGCLVSQRANKTLTREILMPIIPPGNVRTADTSINCLRLHDMWQDVRRR